MKKYLFVLFILFNLSLAQAQYTGIGFGINFGSPIGRSDEISGFSLSVDAEYVYGIYDEIFYVGGTIGFFNAFTKERVFSNTTVEIDNVQFVPVAAVARYYINDSFYAGTDIGYALGINEGNEGGIYFKPKAGFALSSQFFINMSFTGVYSDRDFQAAAFGVEYRL